MALLSRDEFDAIEFDAALSGDHESAAERMTALAQTGIQTSSMPRAEAFVRAGEQWLLADNPQEAVNGFRMAMADGGPVDVDPRVPLARALFQLGKSDEAYALIGKLKSEGSADSTVCNMIMELLVEQSDLTGALEWATSGVRLLLASSPGEAEDPGLRDLLRLRYRIRNDLRLPEDEYDRMISGLAAWPLRGPVHAVRSRTTCQTPHRGPRSRRLRR